MCEKEPSNMSILRYMLVQILAAIGAVNSKRLIRSLAAQKRPRDAAISSTEETSTALLMSKAIPTLPRCLFTDCA